MSHILRGSGSEQVCRTELLRNAVRPNSARKALKKGREDAEGAHVFEVRTLQHLRSELAPLFLRGRSFSFGVRLLDQNAARLVGSAWFELGGRFRSARRRAKSTLS